MEVTKVHGLELQQCTAAKSLLLGAKLRAQAPAALVLAVSSADPLSALKTTAAITPPRSGATMNSHNCCKAQPPVKIAGPMLRAGLIEALVTGMAARLVTVSTRPMARPANPEGAFSSVAPSTVITSNMVKNVSVSNAAIMV